MRRSLAAAPLALVVALAAGCGQAAPSATDFSGEQKKVAQVLEDLQAAGQRDQTTRICRTLLAQPLVQQLGGATCPKAVGQVLDDTDTFEVTVKSVRISGTNARAQITVGRDKKGKKTQPVELVREGQAWKVSRFANASS